VCRDWALGAAALACGAKMGGFAGCLYKGSTNRSTAQLGPPIFYYFEGRGAFRKAASLNEL